MDPDYLAWYNSAFGAPAVQGPAPGPPQMTPDQIAEFYRSVGINPSVGQPPSTRSVQSIPVQSMPPMPRPVPEHATTIARYATPTVSDLVRGNPLQTQERATTIASYPTTRPPSASDKARAFASIPDRLPGGVVPPSLYGGLDPQQVAQIGVGLGNEVNAEGQRVTVPNIPRILVDGANPIQTAKVAPVPFQRPTQVATALDVMPMPPLPRPRPRTAPVPFMRPAFGMGGPAGPAAPMPAPRPGWFGIKLPSLPAMPTFSRPPAMSIPAAARAVNQSGDYSSGNQLEAAQLRASGDAWREAQERKK